MPILQQDESQLRYWRARDVARIYGVTPRTVFSWVASGLIPYHKVGRSLFFSRTDIETMMKRQRFVGGIHCPGF